MRILYLGYYNMTLHDRFNALRRLGHEVYVLEDNAWAITRYRAYQDWWSWHMGSIGIREAIERAALKHIPQEAFDIAWVDSNPVVGPRILEQLKKQCRFVLHYNQDDPFGGRDGRRWNVFLPTV